LSFVLVASFFGRARFGRLSVENSFAEFVCAKLFKHRQRNISHHMKSQKRDKFEHALP